MKIPALRFPAFSHVYLRVNGDARGCVTGYLLRPHCPAQYLVSWDDGEETQHWAEELTIDKPIDGVEEEAEVAAE